MKNQDLHKIIELKMGNIELKAMVVLQNIFPDIIYDDLHHYFFTKTTIAGSYILNDNDNDNDISIIIFPYKPSIPAILTTLLNQSDIIIIRDVFLDYVDPCIIIQIIDNNIII